MQTLSLTCEQYDNIITALRSGIPRSSFFPAVRPNPRVAMALILEANLGLRIGDVLRLRGSSFTRDGDRYRLDIREEKTGKERQFTVPVPIFMYIENYRLHCGIAPDERILPISRRTVESILKVVCDHLGYARISTHSFRKFYATEIYRDSGCDIVLVQHLLQHSSAAVTQHYIGIEPRQMEDAILAHMRLL